MKQVKQSYVWLIAGIAILGFGTVKFWELAVQPQLSRFVGK